MSGIKDVMKGGWHPEGKGGPGTKESWRGENKGINQVAGWVGKGKSSTESTQSQQSPSTSTIGRLKARGTGLVGRGNNATENAYNHQSAPLSSLKDPSVFAPPPKRLDYHASGNRGPGAAVSQTQVRAQREAVEAESAAALVEANGQSTPHQKPYKTDTTGLSTSHLPAPPSQRSGEPGANSRRVPPPPPNRGAKPPLPPRLPPRPISDSTRATPLPPPTHPTVTQSTPARDDYLNAELTKKLNQEAALNDGHLNQESTSRLGRAGISVPGLEIGPSSAFANPWSQERSPPIQSPISSPSMARASQFDGLQNKFSKLSTTSPTSDSPNQGTSFAQKQAALKTATSFREDPSSVSLSDAKSAASTANNFRERHGGQVTAGLRTANGMNQKYGLSSRLDSLATGNHTSPASESELALLSSPTMAPPTSVESAGSIANDKPPPIPPKSARRWQ